MLSTVRVAAGESVGLSAESTGRQNLKMKGPMPQRIPINMLAKVSLSIASCSAKSMNLQVNRCLILDRNASGNYYCRLGIFSGRQTDTKNDTQRIPDRYPDFFFEGTGPF